MNIKIYILIIGLFFSISMVVVGQGVISCCPSVYRYENTDVLPTYTFAEGPIIWGDDAGIPHVSGPVDASSSGPVTFYSQQLIEVKPGSVISPGSALVTGYCDGSFAQANHPGINLLRHPNVFTPNGDGINDTYMINVNSATYYQITVRQWTGSTWGTIYNAYGDITSNWPTLWDGFQGVKSNWNQTYFDIDILLNNCKGPEYLPGRIVVTRITSSSFAPDGNEGVEFDNELSSLNPILGEDPLLQNVIEDNLMITPNPTSGQFSAYVDFSSRKKELTLKVFDLMGREAFVLNDKDVLQKRYEVDLSKEPSGIYLVHVITADGVKIEKVTLSK